MARRTAVVTTLLLLIGSSLSAPAWAGVEVRFRDVARVRARLDLPAGTTDHCGDDAVAERVTLSARVARDVATGEQVQRGFSLSLDCIEIWDGEPVEAGGVTYTPVLKRFVVDDGIVTITFLEHPDTDGPSPRGWLRWNPTVSADAPDGTGLNSCGGVTHRHDGYSSGAWLEGSLLGREVDFNEWVDRGRIDGWTQESTCIW
jgi:hypothetical protein